MAARRLSRIQYRLFTINLVNKISKASYAKLATPSVSAATLSKPKKKLPVETDPVKLVNYVCGSNFYKEGEDVKLKDDSEYPEWLWKLNLGKPPALEELDPNTLEYWETLHKMGLRRQNRLNNAQKLPRMRVNEQDKIKKLKEIRFRALSGYHYDPGRDIE